MLMNAFDAFPDAIDPATCLCALALRAIVLGTMRDTNMLTLEIDA